MNETEFIRDDDRTEPLDPEGEQVVELLTTMIETVHAADHVINTVLDQEIDDARLALYLVRYAKNRAEMFRILAELKGTSVKDEMERSFGPINA